MPATTGAEGLEPEAEEATAGTNVEEAKPTAGVADAEGEQATLTPQAPATATATAAPKVCPHCGTGWSSLPADLGNCIADCLLASNDIDYYMDLRAVCHSWLSITADPRMNQHDTRFRPTQWVMLDEVKHYARRDDDSRLFVNTATGRFLRRSLPLLRGCDLVTSTTGGLLVMAARDSATSKHSCVSVLNPFTGSFICFAAPMPARPWLFTADVISSSPTLALVSVEFNSHNKVYWADPRSPSFSVQRHTKCPASSLPLIAAAKCADVNSCSGSKANKIFDQLAANVRCRCYAVRVPGGDMLAVLKRRRGMAVFKIDSAGNVMEQVKSIGNLALFLGVRCVAVDANMLKGIQANCAYFPMAGSFGSFGEHAIYKVGIEEQEAELLETGVVYGPPYTLTQVLCNYVVDIPHHPPAWELNSKTLSLFQMASNDHD